MISLNWNNFGIKGEGKSQSFEDLCYYLFCRKYGLSEGIRIDFNQKGIETYPIKDFKTNREIGFQSKYFDNKLSQSSSVKQIKESIRKAKDNYPNLSKIIIYTHQIFGSNNPKYKRDIESNAGKLEIEWFLGSNFKIALNQPHNLDLCQLYFGTGDEIGFLKNNSNPQIQTFINSSDFFPIPFNNVNNNLVKNIKKTILELTTKMVLITGSPGSGKTLYMHKLFQQFGGLDKNKINEMLESIYKMGAIPILINLKDCNYDSLENIISRRKDQFNILKQKWNEIFLLDGLDEISESNSDLVISQIYNLSQKKSTNKIILSCRKSNLNLIKLKIYINKYVEYKIAKLDKAFIENYFKEKNNSAKLAEFEKFKKINLQLLESINDILLLKLFWDTIDRLHNNSSILDLIETKINLLLLNPHHYKYLEELNILNPKKDTLIDINKEIAYEMVQKQQVQITQNELQSLILKKYNRLDYAAVNQIVSYLVGIFFEASTSDDNVNNSSFIFQHRRYQEYFFTIKLKYLYEENPKIVRKLNLLSNRDYFENLFIPFLEKGYIENNDLIGMIELNLMKLYIAENFGIGNVGTYLGDSDEFVFSITNLVTLSFNSLMADDSLQIKNYFNIDFQELLKQFKKFNKDKNDYKSGDYIKSIYENGIASLLKNIVIFWLAKKYDFARYLNEQLVDLERLYRKEKFKKKIGETVVKYLRDPYWEKLPYFIYIRLVIKNEKVSDMFTNLIRGNYDYFTDDKIPGQDSKRKTLIKSFFNVCLEFKKTEFFSLMNSFSEHESLIFLEQLCSLKNIKIFIESNKIHKNIKSIISNYTGSINKDNIFILFYKKYFDLSISKKRERFIY